MEIQTGNWKYDHLLDWLLLNWVSFGLAVSLSLEIIGQGIAHKRKGFDPNHPYETAGKGRDGISQKVIYDPPKKVTARLEYPTGFKKKPFRKKEKEEEEAFGGQSLGFGKEVLSEKMTEGFLTQKDFFKELGMAPENDGPGEIEDQLESIILANRFTGTAKSKVELADLMVSSVDQKLAKIRYQREKMEQKAMKSEQKTLREIEKEEMRQRAPEIPDDQVILIDRKPDRHQELNHYFSNMEKPSLENIEAMLVSLRKVGNQF